MNPLHSTWYWVIRSCVVWLLLTRSSALLTHWEVMSFRTIFLSGIAEKWPVIPSRSVSPAPAPGGVDSYTSGEGCREGEWSPKEKVGTTRRSVRRDGRRPPFCVQRVVISSSTLFALYHFFTPFLSMVLPCAPQAGARARASKSRRLRKRVVVYEKRKNNS